jgi:hypothetical protein
MGLDRVMRLHGTDGGISGLSTRNVIRLEFSMSTATVAASSTILPHDPASAQLFRNEFDRTAFAFSQSLDRAECFSYPALLEIAKRFEARRSGFHVEEEDTTPGKGWSINSARKTLVENLEEIEHTHSFVMLKRVHQEPEYKQILEDCIREVCDLTGIDIRKRYRDPLMTVMVTSPFRVTPYHMDAEATLLMQIQAVKSIYIFDGNDRAVLPTTELERYWTGDINAVTYKPELQDRAKTFELVPGGGVFFPVTFPHWVQNGPDVSISVSINFKRVLDNKADVYRVNSRLRKIGLHPKDPGNAQVIDNAKGAIYRAVRGLRRTVSSS